MKAYKELVRPEHQGGQWFIAELMKITRILQ